MKEVKITINGKEYKKTRPTLLDLRRMAEYQKAMQVKKDGKILRKNIAVDERYFEIHCIVCGSGRSNTWRRYRFARGV